MKRKETISSTFTSVLRDVLFSLILYKFLHDQKENRPFLETWQEITSVFEIPSEVNLKDFDKWIKPDLNFYIKSGKKYIKKLIVPKELKPILCRTRVLYLYFLKKFPRTYARILASYYAFIQPEMKHYPLFFVICLIAEALNFKATKLFFTEKNLEDAFQVLKMTILKDIKEQSYQELISDFLIPDYKIANP